MCALVLFLNWSKVLIDIWANWGLEPWIEASCSFPCEWNQMLNLELKPVAHFHESETSCWTLSSACCSFPCEWNQMLNLELKPVACFCVSETRCWTFNWSQLLVSMCVKPVAEPGIEACCSFPCEWNHLVNLESPHCVGVNWGSSSSGTYIRP